MMRSRIVLIALAVVIALVGIYVGWVTNTPKAVGEPATATPADSSVEPAQRRGSGSEPARSPAAPSPSPSAPKPSPPKAAAGHATQPSQTPGTPPTSLPPPNTDPVRFGKVTTTPSNDTLETAISPDRRALTTSFSDFEVIVNGKVTEPDATKSFSMTLPLTGGANGDVVGFHVQGFTAVEEGATARVTLRGGGKTIVRDFPSGIDKSFVESLWLPATPGITYQLSVVIEIHKDAAGGGDGYLNAAVVDVGIS
jgi:hypothetical protein